MQIIWYGHSCFLIKTSIGKRFLIQPFDNITECNRSLPKSDLILTNSNCKNIDLNTLNNNTKIFCEAGIFHILDFEIEGLNSFQDKCNGLKRGPNIIYIIKDSKHSLCHLGNVGHIPSSLVIEKIKNIDILFVPIGGNFTLNASDAAKLCKLAHPKYIIPMQYKTNNNSLYLDDPKDFIISMKNVKKVNSNIINTSNLNFKYDSECLLLTSHYS
jgi:L-ascorbate metabolism protein UlaG (beta-lactamase superfamily)